VRELRRRRGQPAPEELPDVLHLELVEANEESQRKWGRRRIDWDSVGFGERTDADIAEELGVSKSVVTRIRTEKKLASVRRYKGDHIEWDGVDFHKSDAQIARDLEIHVDTVRKARRRFDKPRAATFRGRGAAVTDVDWDNEPLGQVSDQELAKRHNVSSSTVFLARTRRGIPPFQVASLGIDWDAQPFGKVTDAELGRKLGVSKRTIQRQREARGISPLHHSPKVTMKRTRTIDWNLVDFTVRDATNAEMLGVSRWVVREERIRRGLPTPPRPPSRAVIDWDAEPLGKVPDAEIAARLNVNPKTVQKERTKRRIPSALPPGRPKHPALPTSAEVRSAAAWGARAARAARAGRPADAPEKRRTGYHAKIDWDAQPLGKITDGEIARLLGVDVSSVRDARLRRKIPPAVTARGGRPPRAESPPAPASSR
jgi:hypothetical protein